MDMINRKETNDIYEQLTLKSKIKDLNEGKKIEDEKIDELGGNGLNNNNNENNNINNEQMNHMNEI